MTDRLQIRAKTIQAYPFPDNRDEGTGPRVLAIGVGGYVLIAHYDAGAWYDDAGEEIVAPFWWAEIPELVRSHPAGRISTG